MADPSEEIAQKVLKLIAEGAGGALETYAKALEKIQGLGTSVVKPLETFDKYVKENGLQSWIATTMQIGLAESALNGMTAALTRIGIPTKNLTGALQDLKAATDDLAGASEKELKIRDALIKMTTLQTTGIGDFTKILVPAAGEVQKFQIAMEKAGRDGYYYSESLANLAQNTTKLGISYTDLKENTLKYVEESVKGVALSKTQKEAFDREAGSMGELISFQKKFGVSAEETIKVLNFTGQAFGLSNKKSQEFTDTLDKFATETGQPVQKVFAEMNANLDKFAGLSAERAIGQFQRMELYAKRTGQSVNTILTGLEAFDDLSSGQEKLGQINQLLMSFGGQAIDPMAFLNATQEQRETILLNALSSVQDISSMTEQSRRILIKRFGEVMPGMNPQTLASLLNLAPDQRGAKMKELTDALTSTPETATLTGYSDRDREEIARKLTSTEDMKKLRDALIETQSEVRRLSERLRITSFQQAEEAKKIYKEFNETYFKATVERDVAAFGKFTSKAIEASTTAFKQFIVDLGMKESTDALTDSSTTLKSALEAIIPGGSGTGYNQPDYRGSYRPGEIKFGSSLRDPSRYDKSRGLHLDSSVAPIPE